MNIFRKCTMSQQNPDPRLIALILSSQLVLVFSELMANITEAAMSRRRLIVFAPRALAS